MIRAITPYRFAALFCYLALIFELKQQAVGQTIITTSTTINGTTFVGSGSLTIDGGGSLQLLNGAQSTGISDLVVGLNSSGSITVSSGSTLTNSVAALLGVNGGAFGTVTVTGSGSGWNSTDVIQVGYYGSGALNILSGGYVTTSARLFIGYGNTGSGALLVDGAGSKLSLADNLYISNVGSATLTISNGGRVSDSVGFISYNGGPGSVVVTGSGSTWTNTTGVYVGGQYLDGPTGPGSLLIADGGTVSAGSQLHIYTSGTVTVSGGTASGVEIDVDGQLFVQNGGVATDNYGVVGFESGMTGTATINGAGSVWSSANNLYVGYSGTGRLNVQNGGLAYSTGDIHLGFNAGGRGIATVSGTDAELITVNAMVVGSSGAGTLNVQSGGFVGNAIAIVGYQPGSTGTVTVDGYNSTWANIANSSVYDSYIGFQGNANVTITGGGTVINNNAYLGAVYGGSYQGVGVVNVSGSDGLGHKSTWTSLGSVYLSGTANSWQGLGTVNLLTDGVMNVGGTVKLWNDGTLNVSGGELTTRNLDKSVGFLNFTAGTITVSGGTFTHAVGTGSAANLLIADGTGAPKYVLSQGATAAGIDAIILGGGAAGELAINGGSVISQTGSAAFITGYNGFNIYRGTSAIGYLTGATGTASVSGTGSQWNMSSELAVGNFGRGTLSIDNGGVVRSSTGVVGYNSPGVGLVTVSGQNSQWTVTNEIFVGYSGTGTVQVSNGGVVQSGSFVRLGAGSNGVGTVSISGANSQWTSTGYIDVGFSGRGTLSIQNGAKVSSLWGTLAPTAAGTGTATIDGAGSQWLMSSDLYVGYGGTGYLSVQNGGLASNSYGNIAVDPGSTGTAVVTGTGSQWTMTNILNVGTAGTGSLLVQSGAAVKSLNGNVGNNSSGVGSATIDGAGSQWSLTNLLGVGISGTGALNVQNGGRVTSNFGVLGDQSTGSGTAIIDGANSLWSLTSELIVGGFGTGTLQVQNGGSIVSYAARLGGVSAALVTGAGSAWTNSTGLVVGWGGNGTLNILSGGSVSDLGTDTFDLGDGTNVTAGAIISTIPGAVGSVTVSGGNSRWDNAYGLIIGGASTATGGLVIQSGGSVSSFDGSIGRAYASTGTATIDGANSQWSMTGGVNVGYSGSGTLSILNGGKVISGSASLGVNAPGNGFTSSGNGTATISGANSQWSVTNSLYVGGSSTSAGGFGSLTVTSGGAVNIGGTLKLWSAGTLTIGAGGSVTARSFDRSLGTLNLNGGTLTVSGGTYTHAVGTGSAANILTLDGTGTPQLQLTQGATAVGVDALVIGATNSAVLNISGGSVVSNTGTTAVLGTVAGISISRGRAYLGLTSAGAGAVTVEGANSQWNLSQLLVVGSSGTGTLAIQNGGLVDTPSTNLGTNPNSSGAVTIEGADSRLTSTSIIIGNAGRGIFNIQSGGTAIAKSATLGFVAAGSGTATIAGAGSQWTVGTVISDALTIGQSGAGTVNVLDGGKVIATRFSVGSLTSGIGVITVSGNGSQLTESFGMSVGFSGTGNLSVLAGGRADGAGAVSIGVNSAATGTTTVSGADSIWSTSGSLEVGRFGRGYFNIQDGGSGQSDSLLVAGAVGGVGTVTVDGATSTLTTTDAIYVGFSGTGTLNIQGGGTVASAFGTLGFNSASHGTATISGADSKWNLGSLYVGSDVGSGVLNVVDGGRVTTTSASQISNGTATVTGANSEWKLLNNLVVGGSATLGVLNIADGGTVHIGLGTDIGPNGSITVGNGGTLQTGTLAVMGGGQFTVDAGGVVAGAVSTTGDFVLNGRLSGDVAVHDGGNLGGSGVVVGKLSGEGLVAPGNSPGVLDAAQVDPSSGMDFLFQFTAANTVPDYLNRTASLNDVLHLTDATTPFLTSLGPSNTITVDFEVGALHAGDTFLGGFFTNQPGVDFYGDGTVNNAIYSYLLNGSALDLNQWHVSISTIAQANVDFGMDYGGTVDGRIMQFQVTAVPEPGSLAMVGTAAVGYYLRRRRKITQAVTAK